ncbi:gamma carbonic anhydrase family protein [Hahella sp. CCB-MM4]|uniref:gamma carbonic anhydrase family protein n=1 Tax=Hahella sp. (strain CCB-MM4) TaxID=1926491 RepID=UPI000B9C6F65|nr:gamma carbonic anhydrase family protein [Hahella sp. CCB-MM4]OZG70117.1 gamma carbonic anhydrase family protein [Hahella sp. CCB-MM4]
MLYSLGNKKISLNGAGHFIADTATLIGEVVLEDQASVWFGAVVRADNDVILIGPQSNIQDQAVLHTDPGIKLKIGKGVTVGHHAILHGCEVGDYSLIGINAVILNNARIGRYCIIGANALIPENAVIPDGSLVVGSPGKVKRSLNEQERKALESGALHYVENARRYSASLKEQSDE